MSRLVNVGQIVQLRLGEVAAALAEAGVAALGGEPGEALHQESLVHGSQGTEQGHRTVTEGHSDSGPVV
jgi:hypothetical protein